MKTKKKIWLVSFICFALGIVILAAGMFLGGRPGFYIDGSGVHAAGDAEKMKVIREEVKLDGFSEIEVNAEYTDVQIIPSDKYAVEYCIESGSKKPVCEVKNNKFVFREAGNNNIEWQFMAFSGMMTTAEKTDYYIRVYVPEETEFTSVILKTSDGDVTVPDMKSGVLEIEDEYGDVKLGGFQGNTLKLTLEEGKLTSGRVISDTLETENEYGDMDFEEVQADTWKCKMEDGNLTVRKATAENLEIQNEYGDVCLGIAGAAEEYDWDLATEYGKLTVAGTSISSSDDEIKYTVSNHSERKVKIVCEDGNIEIIENQSGSGN